MSAENLKYRRFLLEAISYSFDNEDTEEVSQSFNQRKIGDMAEILSTIGPEEGSIWTRRDIDYSEDIGEECHQYITVMKRFIANKYKNWKVGPYFITSVSWIQSLKRNEYICIDFELSNRHEIIFNLKTDTYVYMYINKYGKEERLENLKTFGDMFPKNLEEAFIDIIHAFKPHLKLY